MQGFLNVLVTRYPKVSVSRYSQNGHKIFRNCFQFRLTCPSCCSPVSSENIVSSRLQSIPPATSSTVAPLESDCQLHRSCQTHLPAPNYVCTCLHSPRSFIYSQFLRTESKSYINIYYEAVFNINSTRNWHIFSYLFFLVTKFVVIGKSGEVE